MLRKYGVIGSLKIIISVIYTKLFFNHSRLLRLPIDIRNHKMIDFGHGLTTGRYCRIEAYPQDKKSIVIRFGRNVQINDFVHITAMKSVYIGNNVLLASKIYISDCSHGSYDGDKKDSAPDTHPIKRKYKTSAVRIDDNVWIGESVSILPGTSIGTNSIIGANSVVTRNVPPNCIAVGNPAKVIKKYNFETKKWERTQ